MKAVGYRASHPIEHAEALLDLTLDKPVAAGRDLLVKVEAVSVNPVDTKMRLRSQPEDGGVKVLGWDAAGTVEAVGPVDLAYLDPPYNQHRYETNYHVWETLVRGDEPDHYGVACKRVDSRDLDLKSVFNVKRSMPAALADLVARVRAEVVVVSCNDESWVAPEDLVAVVGELADLVEIAVADHDRLGRAELLVGLELVLVGEHGEGVDGHAGHVFSIDDL